MKAVIQRVTSASVSVDGATVSSIARGLCVLVGIGVGDQPDDVNRILNKVLNIRLFSDVDGKAWSKSVMDIQGEVLFVSQFTLQSVLKGRKPDFHNAMPPDAARTMYQQLLADAGKLYVPDKIKDGVFGAMMSVNIVNDGPVTINLDTKEK
eukprot:TRINITY_DN4284_c0_g1_i1.p1 TRINITY_DN4284_c0_g1~~TRINITY_DN4284_c0_g1_i1.p1  ORF type:complete len:151 (-),score=42.18 TRINITY_DN4284_c0_g1_i1:190-642(-)